MGKSIDPDQQIRALEARKSKLLKLVDLQGEVARLELQLLFGGREDVQSARIVSEVVGRHYQISLEVVHSNIREPRIVEPRHVIYHLLNKHTKASMNQIGRMFNKDHATIMHALRSVRDRLETEP